MSQQHRTTKVGRQPLAIDECSPFFPRGRDPLHLRLRQKLNDIATGTSVLARDVRTERVLDVQKNAPDCGTCPACESVLEFWYLPGNYVACPHCSSQLKIANVTHVIGPPPRGSPIVGLLTLGALAAVGVLFKGLIGVTIGVFVWTVTLLIVRRLVRTSINLGASKYELRPTGDVAAQKGPRPRVRRNILPAPSEGSHQRRAAIELGNEFLTNKQNKLATDSARTQHKALHVLLWIDDVLKYWTSPSELKARLATLRRLRNRPGPSYWNPHLSQHLARIDFLLSTTQKIPAVIGALPDKTTNASASSLFGSAHVIDITEGQLLFGFLFSKSVVQLICSLGDGPAGFAYMLGVRPRKFRRTSAMRRFRELAVAHVQTGEPSRAPAYSTRELGDYRQLYEMFTIAIELFIIGHEYYHLLTAVSEVRATTSALDEDVILQEETEADKFGLELLLADCHESETDPRLALAPAILMQYLGLLERDGAIREPRDHPPSFARANSMVQIVREAMEREGASEFNVRQMQLQWNAMSFLLEEAWAEVRNDVLAMKKMSDTV